MIAYWILFATPVLVALMPYRGDKTLKRTGWVLVWAIYTLAIGFRHEIGCDWSVYMTHYEVGLGSTLGEIMSRQGGDPGFFVLNWLIGYLGGEVYGVNLVCGAIFMLGVIIFARRQPFPWLAFAIAVPYLLIAVAMGYTRQSVALGLTFWALALLEDGRFLKYVLLISVAALFHKSALLMLPLGLVVSSRSDTARFIGIGVLCALLGLALVYEHYESLYTYYISEQAQMESQGGAIRVWMNVVPALIMFAGWKRWRHAFPDPRIWLWIGVLSIACIPLVAIASTAVDRVALYFTPLQIAVFARWPSMMRTSLDRTFTAMGIFAFYAAVLFVWLNYGIHAVKCWIPYQTPWF